MGSRIAAHLANAQIPSLLLDIVRPDKAVDTALKGRPGAFFIPESARLISTGTFDDDLPEDQRLRLDRRGRNREPRHQARALRSRDSASQRGNHRLDQHQRHSARADLGGLSGGIPRSTFSARTSSIRPATCISWKSFPARKPAPTFSPSSPISATAIWAKASFRARIRRTSSATASARSSAPTCSGSPSNTI